MQQFLDYYEMLQISPNAESATIQRVYRMLATRYHPDNRATGDPGRFLKLQEAYEVLSDKERRPAYDEEYRLRRTGPLKVFEDKEFVVGIEAEANRRLGVLCLLYNQRRDDAFHPSMTILDLELVMSFPREHLEFTAWYLREKGLIRRDDHGELMITAEGVDFVEERRSDNPIMQRLLMPPASVVSGQTGLRMAKA